MKKYYFTFMFSQFALKYYYVEIEAPSEPEARNAMVENFGLKWAMEYTIKPITQHAPKGCLLKITLS